MLKARGILTAKSTCSCCASTLKPPYSDVLVCASPSCNSASHVLCLAKDFLSKEDPSSSEGQVLPYKGTCPDCATNLTWKDLIQELSLRTRVPVKEKVSRAKKGPIVPDSEGEDSELDDDQDAEDEEAIQTAGVDDYADWIYQPPDDDLDGGWEEDIASEKEGSVEPRT